MQIGLTTELNDCKNKCAQLQLDTAAIKTELSRRDIEIEEIQCQKTSYINTLEVSMQGKELVFLICFNLFRVLIKFMYIACESVCILLPTLAMIISVTNNPNNSYNIWDLV